MTIFRKVIWALKSNEAKFRLMKKKGLRIGDNCSILNGWEFGSEPWLVSLGDNVRLAAGVKIVTHEGGLWVLRQLYPEFSKADILSPVVVGNNCHIGMNAILMPGVTIGNNCIIGCNAVVTHDIPDNSIAAGVPARVISDINSFKDKHSNDCIMTKGMTSEEKREYYEAINQGISL